MKKLLAVILAVLLLGSVCAFAETGSTLDLKDPTLAVTSEGETTQFDFAGLTLRFGTVGEEDDTRIVLNIFGEEELLFAAEMKVEDGRALLTADGFSHSYAVALPGVGETDEADDGESGLPAISTELMEKIMSEAEIGFEGETITFRLPYTAVNGLLKELLPTVDAIPNADELVAQLEEMEAAGEGIELAGTLSVSDGFHIDLNIVPVSGGEAAAESVFRLCFDLDPVEDGADFCLSALSPEAGDEPVFSVNGSFRTNADGMTLHLDVLSAADPVAVFDLSVGDDFLLTLELADSFRFETSYVKADSLLNVTVDTADFAADLTAAAVSGEEELHGCVFPDDVVELGGDMSEELQEQFSEELQTAFAPVLEFLAPALQEAGVTD